MNVVRGSQRNHLFRSVAVAALAMSATLLNVAPSFAQSSQLQEIIVTARKRQESILNVPVVETAVSQQTLERLQAKDLKDISTLVPGLALGDNFLSIGTQVSLRGVGTSTYDPGIDQSVSLNIDGLQLSQGLAYSSGFFDAGQIEVLKGPQALFYGKSSPGGVISIRTADPTDKFEVIARAAYEFEAREKRGELIVSGPLSETVKARLAGMVAHSDGFYKNIAIGLPALGGVTPKYNRSPGARSWTVRGTLLWNPSTSFDARVKLVSTRDKFLEAGVLNLISCPDGLAPINLGPGFSVPFMNPNDGCRKDRKVSLVDLAPSVFGGLVDNKGYSFVDSTQTYGTVELNFRPQPDLTLTSQTGYYLLHSTGNYNGGNSGSSGPLYGVVQIYRRHQFTEELRLNSDFDGPLNFTAGGFVERGHFTNLTSLPGNTALGVPALLLKGVSSIHIKTNSVFGQARYLITPQLELAAGARWTDETRTYLGNDLTTGRAVFIPKPRPKIGSKNVSPELTLTFRPTDDLTWFAALKRGYKSGSYNVGTPPMLGIDNSFGDERVTGGEVGVKARLLDRALLFNLAGYMYRYKGLQVGSLEPIQGGVPVTRTLNAGSAKVQGVETDITYRPPSVENLTLRLAANWNRARFTRLGNVPCYGGQRIQDGCNLLFDASANTGLGGFTAQDLSGLPLIRAAKWQANFGFDWELPLGSDMKLVVTQNNHLSTKYLVNLALPTYQSGFIKSDLSLAMRGPNDRWEVALVGKNITNKLTTGTCSNFNGEGGGLPGTVFTGTTFRSIAGVDETGCLMDRGREIWVRVTFRPFS